VPRSPKPGGAVIEPRSYATVTGKFGKTTTLLADAPIETAQRAAAELQHAIANHIREFLIDKATTLRSFCAAIEMPAGVTYERLYRINAGVSMITMTDLAFWSAHVADLPEFVAVAMRRLRPS
jgi:hypothetical protein